MSKKLNKRKYSLVLLVGVLALMGIGYAYLSTTVNFNGTALINSTQWNIYLDNIQVTEGSVTPTTAAVINDAKTEVTYGVTLVNPGDFYEFTVDVKNDGSIDGMIESISSKLNNAEITSLPSYLDYDVTYLIGTEIEKNHFLKASTMETYKVRIGFREDITVEQLPTENQTLNLSLSVSYKQADNSGIEVPTVVTRYSTNSYTSYSNYDFSKSYATKTSFMLRNNNRPFYISKKDNENEAHLEFIVTEEMVKNNPGMKPGTYRLSSASSYSGSIATVDIVKEAFGYDSFPERCGQVSTYADSSTSGGSSNTSYSCSVAGLTVISSDMSYVVIDDDGFGCSIVPGGGSSGSPSNIGCSFEFGNLKR